MKRFLMTACVTACLALGLGGCGGGGGGGATPSQSKTVTGDMLALAPSRGWNYQGEAEGTAITLSLYVEPQLLNGDQVLVVGAGSGTVPTLLTSAANFEADAGADAGFLNGSSGYAVIAEASLGGAYLVPGSPTLVGSSLTAGTVSSPYPGVTETVLAVGTVPGANACPTPTSGATVQYNFQNLQATLSYVPGCGITQFSGPGESFTLISTAAYASIGETSSARMLAVGPLDMVRSILVLEHEDFPGGHLLTHLFH